MTTLKRDEVVDLLRQMADYLERSLPEDFEGTAYLDDRRQVVQRTHGGSFDLEQYATGGLRGSLTLTWDTFRPLEPGEM